MEIRQNNQIIIYQTEDGQISFNVNVFENTVWLTQKQMAELFGRDRKTITRHIANVFKEGELNQNSVCSYFEHTAEDGKIYNVIYYNLDVIISVGYRVKSQRGTQFRIWATKILDQYLINGYVVNERKIKQIQSSIDYLVESNKVLREDVSYIKNQLATLIEKPIIIHHNSHNHIHNYNQISLVSNELEEKIIKLLDQLIKEVKPDQELTAELQEVKEMIKASSKDQKAKNKIKNFFTRLGDKDSDLYKTVQGAGIAKKIITELIKLGEKLKDMIF